MYELHFIESYSLIINGKTEEMNNVCNNPFSIPFHKIDECSLIKMGS